MSKEELQWLLITASNGPVQTTAEARIKASCLQKLADELDEAVKPNETTADPVPTDSL